MRRHTTPSGRAALAASPAAASLSSTLVAAADSLTPAAGAALARAHGAVGHASPALVAVLAARAPAAAATGGADGAAWVAALVASPRVGTAAARAALLAQAAPSLAGGGAHALPLRTLCDVAAATAAILAAGQSGGLADATSDDAASESDDGLWAWGDAAAAAATAGRSPTARAAEAGAPPPPALPAPAHLAAAVSLFDTLATSAAGREHELDGASVARLARALVESGALRAARRARGAPVPVTALLDALCRRVQAGVLDGRAATPPDVCNTAWALGRAARTLPHDAAAPALSALAALARPLETAAPSADAAAVAAAAWGLAANSGAVAGACGAASGDRAAAALDALASRAAALAARGGADPRWAATTLWALARARHRHRPAFAEVAACVDAASLRPRDGATLALAAAHAGCWDAPAVARLLDGIGVATLDALSRNECPPRAAANVCYALAAAGRLPPRLQAAAAAAAARAPTPPPPRRAGPTARGSSGSARRGRDGSSRHPPSPPHRRRCDRLFTLSL